MRLFGGGVNYFHRIVLVSVITVHILSNYSVNLVELSIAIVCMTYNLLLLAWKLRRMELLNSNCQLIPPSSSNSDTNTIQLTDPSSSAITITNPTSRIESSPNEQGIDHVDKNRRIGEIVLGLDIAPGEEPLPEGWELARTASGRKFFINHNEHTTTWDDPRVIRPNNQITNGSLLTHEAQRHVMKDLGPLPPGWEERVHSNGRIFYINHSKLISNLKWFY
ncbi:uncharacterized protein DC041_0007118 [Schistosoma bovis]|uniref:WW domain-containing protein n=1 Tax=Schistosoma bovis TaxID=6184 RepID=A0A430QKP4_SCHBO|nr:uncharacterized protein DC041_0007118 [Schistosoma bovis]